MPYTTSGQEMEQTLFLQPQSPYEAESLRMRMTYIYKKLHFLPVCTCIQ